MDDLIEFLRAFSDLECRVRVAKQIEPDQRKFQDQVWALDEMYSGGLRSGLSRPSEPAEVYASAVNVEEAARQKPRSTFAVARYKIDGDDIYRAWMGSTQVGDRGDSIRQNLYLHREDGKLKIIGINRLCSGCFGTGLANGETCETCGGPGWVAHRGTEWPSLGEALEVRKLERPTDPITQPCYDAIPIP